ncbi:Heme-binding protein 2 [Tetrabaena socialis]|uniref:Heme-binding protein 2 n=1 Tax=Tetrabaena socialis TaxID=47790 RepID=A0A2J7ZVX7_9CHLO|nr:Heme-binding protein 2 [Tetrabaena socialis]|eukprot:PNH04420.1 Heme-binding protein 2 [Tetrabaena socialis]
MARRSTAPLVAALIALACCAATQAARLEGSQPQERAGLSWSPPSFCRRKDCPEFQVLQTRDDVELRRYKPAHWISTNVTNAKWGDAYDEGYARLQKYVGGDNDKGAKLQQTNPSFTLLYVADEKAHTLQSLFTVEYFVPFELQDAPPQPTAEDVGVMHVSQQDVWVLTFGGYATEDVVVDRAFEFIANLTGDGIDVFTEFVGVALYDQPARLIDRHNELWLWAKEPAPSASTAFDTAAAATQASMDGLEAVMQRLFGAKRK